MSSESKLPLIKARSAFSIFCDDIRREDTGKMLFIGVYDNALLAPELPATLPSLKVYLTVTTPVTQPFQTLKIICYLNDDIVSEVLIELAEEQPKDWAESQEHEKNKLVRVQKFQGILDLGALRFDKPSNLKVRVHTESEVLAAGALRLDAIPLPVAASAQQS